MKKILALLVAFSSIQMVYAQNPFEQFGYKGKILTATNGRFNEFHDLDSVVQIGSVLLDVHKLVIVGDAPTDTVTYMPSPTVISRWLSPDPLSEKYYSITPYNFVYNNPINYVDPDGRDGIASVDKDKRTINISQTFYYNKNNENFAKQGITKDISYTSGPFAGTTQKSELGAVAENGFGSQSHTIKDADGNEWTVSFTTNFVGLESDDAVSEMLSSDATANKLEYVPDLDAAGRWSAGERSLKIGPGRDIGDETVGQTTTHEIGHSWGLPHENAMPNSPIYGESDNGLSSTQTNGIMSYSNSREIKTHEVQYGAQRVINAANGSQNSSVKVHVVGSQRREHKVIQ